LQYKLVLDNLIQVQFYDFLSIGQNEAY